MSGGGSAPTSQTVTQTTVPEYLRPYVEEMAGQARGLAQYEIESGYKPYMGQRFAGFAPMQAQAFQNVAGQQVAPQLTDASNIAFGAGSTGLQAAGQGQALGQQAGLYGGMGAEYGALGGAIGSRGVEAAEQGFGAGQAYQQMATDPSQMQAYMSPYMQNVVEAQQREARRASEIQQQANQAQAVQQGAYGGSRQAIVEAERQRNLGTQLGDIQAAGLQKAYQDAQQTQQFGAQLGLQGLGAGYQGLQAGLAGTAQGISGAQAGLQGVQGAIGAGQYGLAGAQAATGAAGQLGALGGQQFEQQMATTDAMQKYGALQQQQQQQALDYQYQQYLAEQNLPYQQLGYFSDMIRGLPLSQSSTSVYGGQPDVASQLGGLALASTGFFGGRKEGGQIKKYQEGGSVSAEGMQLEDVMGLRSKLRRLSDSQLAAYARVAKDAITLSAVQGEIERRSKMRQPYTEGPQQTTAQGIAQRAEQAAVGKPRVGMAGGGIVALQEAGRPMDNPNYVSRPEEIEALGVQLDSARTAYDNATKALRSYGSVQQRQDPEGYATAVQAANAANEQRKELQKQYEAMMSSTPAAQPYTMRSAMDQGRPAAGISAANRIDTAPVPPPTPTPTPTPKPALVPAPTPSSLMQPDEFMADATTPIGIEAAGADRRQKETPANEQPSGPASSSENTPAGGSQTPSMGGLTFDQYRQMASQVEPNPEDQAVLADMQQRIQGRMERAEGQQDRAIYDALLTAGLAMMGGNSLADGIAKAAQMGGATFMASKKDAQKALDAAENAEIAFRQYELDVMKGNEKAAREEFGAFLDYTTQLAAIDARYATIGAKSASGLDAKDVSLLRGRVEKQVNDRYGNVMPTNETEAAQLEADKRNLRNALLTSYGIAPIAQNQATGGAGDRPPLSSFAQ